MKKYILVYKIYKKLKIIIKKITHYFSDKKFKLSFFFFFLKIIFFYSLLNYLL